MRGKWYVAGVGVITCLLLVASCNTVDVLSSQGLDQSVSGDPAVLTVTGDAQINRLWPLSRMSSRLGSGELIAFAGDYRYNGTYYEITHILAALGNSNIPKLASVVGNHDWANRHTGYDVALSNSRTKTSPYYYAISFHGWRLVFLNTVSDMAVGSAQHKWFMLQMAAPGSKKIVFGHHPRYSATVRADDVRLQPYWTLMSGHAIAYISGHDHCLGRFVPQNGVVQFVTGGAGATLVRVRRRSTLAFGASTYGMMRITLGTTSAKFEMMDTNGRVLNSSSFSARTQ